VPYPLLCQQQIWDQEGRVLASAGFVLPAWTEGSCRITDPGCI
jgi:hypothetical protein